MSWKCDCASDRTIVHYVCECGLEWSTDSPPLDPDGRPGIMPCPDGLSNEDGTPADGCGRAEVMPTRARCADCKAETYFA